MNDNQKTKAQLLVELGRPCAARLKGREDLKKSGLAGEEKYLAILEHIEDGYYEVDLSGKYTFVNASVCKYHGRSPEELIGQSYRKFLADPGIGPRNL